MVDVFVKLLKPTDGYHAHGVETLTTSVRCSQKYTDECDTATTTFSLNMLVTKCEKNSVESAKDGGLMSPFNNIESWNTLPTSRRGPAPVALIISLERSVNDDTLAFAR